MTKYSIKILKTPMVEFLPHINLHHVVILKEKEKKKEKSSIYAIDFTPIDQHKIETLKNLLSGKHVPAEIRVIPILKSSFDNEEALFNEWELKREKPRKPIVLPILDGWRSDTIHLYNHNCQHFSRFLKQKILDDQ
uniref:LRAT domain-containing protein n=1 Tax=viral metagenome TaxID=1070528 RepID=A0A6C0LEX1_9ZZZZ